MSRKFAATIKETESGQPYIVIEAHEPNGLPDDQIIKIDFEQGAQIDAATKVASSLNSKAESICVVKW